LESALVSLSLWVWVRRVERGVPTIVAAVGTIDGVQKVVQETFVGVIVLIDWVIGLEEDRVLWIDDRVRDLEVEVRLRAGFVDTDRGHSSVDGFKLGMSANRDLSIAGQIVTLRCHGSDLLGQSQEELVQVSLRIDVAQVLEDTKLTTRLGVSGLCNVVKFCDTRRGSCDLANTKLGETQKLADCQWECFEERWLLCCLAIGYTKGTFLDRVLVVDCVPAPSWREKLDTWSDVIDVLAQVLGYVISGICQRVSTRQFGTQHC
jgi:hypothetical protein